MDDALQRLFDPWLIFQGRFKDIASAGSLEDVAVAIKVLGDDDCYGFTNESYYWDVWRMDKYRLPKGTFVVTAIAVSGEVRSKPAKFLLHNDGPALTDLWLDVPKAKPAVRSTAPTGDAYLGTMTTQASAAASPLVAESERRSPDVIFDP